MEEKTAAPALAVTDSAARKLKEMIAAEGLGPEYGLRVGIQGGGCSGFTYAMQFDTPQEGDAVIEHDGIKVYVDPRSAQMLAGSQIDYVESLMGAGFKVSNPNATGGCGCGNSFSV